MRMVRQKVKGTGHKQPADANTEPNFYIMQPQPDDPDDNMNMPTSIQGADHLSPGSLHGLHGAASLLHGISAGFNHSMLLPQVPFVGQTTAIAPAPADDGSGSPSKTLTSNYARRVQSEADSTSLGQATSFLSPEPLSPSAEEEV
jgi:hypothetical protein